MGRPPKVTDKLSSEMTPALSLICEFVTGAPVVIMFARFLNVFNACGPFRIRKNATQNNPTEAFERLSHEFRNKIERPRAMSVTLDDDFWSADDMRTKRLVGLP